MACLDPLGGRSDWRGRATGSAQDSRFALLGLIHGDSLHLRPEGLWRVSGMRGQFTLLDQTKLQYGVTGREPTFWRTH